jgi:transcriptional regulator with XRE-family HTH domain
MSAEEVKKHKGILPEHQKLMTAIGIAIKELRISKKKGYIEMAEMIGISRNEYNLIELGKIYFKFSTLLKILDHHGISYADFSKTL